MAPKILLLSLALLLSGCAATTQDVVPIGKGNYEIAGSAGNAFSSGGAEKVKLLQIANQYCAKDGRQAVLVDATDTNGHARSSIFVPGGILTKTGVLGEHATADVVFQCQ